MLTETYTPGELVIKSSSYTSNYPDWKVTRGIILSVKKRTISDESLKGAASDRALYRSRYGNVDSYPCFEMLISTNEGNFVVSQFGFNKDSQ